MATLKLTKQQKTAVENRGGDLLVSAAAGSGKTKVLVERLISQIRDEGKNITDFVIITYTNKAAEELRAKIRAELSAIVAENPNIRDEESKRLRAQLQLLYSANISTVHAYCGRLLRENASTTGLAADFRVLDEREARLIKANCMGDVLEEIYRDVHNKKDAELEALVEQLGYGRDGDKAIPAMIYHAYETIQSHTWPEKWVAESLAKMDTAGYSDIAQTDWGAYLMENIKAYVQTQLPRVEAAIRLLDRDEILASAYSSTLVADREKMRDILASRTWDDLCVAVENGWARLNTPRAKKDGSTNYDIVLKDTVKDIRDRYKKAIEARSKPVNTGRSKELLDDVAMTAESVRGLFKAVRRFSSSYGKYKAAHNMLDFNDLEHRTIEMLVDEQTGEFTDIAKTLQKRYAGIYIDEYQDTNAVQETIFTAISNNNRFMVGDVKQSIYQFRLADPSIFLRHYSMFADAESAMKNEPRKVLLTKNFRSREEILDATNEVMRTCMSPIVGGVEYTEDEMLTCGREFPVTASDTRVELDVINLTEEQRNAGDDAEDDGLDMLLKADIESRFVAQSIAKMLREKETVIDEETGEERPVRASDIAILLRSAKNSAKHYDKALSDFGIRCVTPKAESILETTEGAALFSLLQVLDNQQQDIPLVSTLASPLFGFTAEDLARVRIADKTAKSYYQALRAAADTMPKAKVFIDFVTELRAAALHMQLPQLYQLILERTDALDVFGAMSNGNQRMDNINALGEAIAAFTARGGRGLFQFITETVAMREQGDDMEKPNISDGDDAVTITSVHSSKGLEYPIVILADMSRNFNQSDLKDTILMHAKLGVGVQVTDTAKKVRYPTIARSAIAMRMREEAKSEELRILYVALTRAQQKLIMCYTGKDMRKVMTRLASVASNPLSPTVSQSVSSPGEWVLLTAVQRDEAVALLRLCDILPDTRPSRIPWNVNVYTPSDIGVNHKTLQELEEKDATSNNDAELVLSEQLPLLEIEHLTEDLQFKYPHEAEIGIQSKIVATEFARKTDEDTAPEISCRRPDFEKAKTKATAVERGTATHKFLQYANYAKIAEDGSLGVEEELARLKNLHILDAAEAKAVMTKAVETFFTKNIGRRLAETMASCQGSGNLFQREFPFSILVNASELDESVTDSGDPRSLVMLQGVIDLFYIDEKNGIHIYDFKTDYIETEQDMEEKVKRYKPQLDVYERALLEIYGNQYHIADRALIFIRNGEARAA